MIRSLAATLLAVAVSLGLAFAAISFLLHAVSQQYGA